MIVLTEQQRNVKRFEALSKGRQQVLNIMAMNEFLKPIKFRHTAVALLDMVEFYDKRNLKKNRKK